MIHLMNSPGRPPVMARPDGSVLFAGQLITAQDWDRATAHVEKRRAYFAVAKGTDDGSTDSTCPESAEGPNLE